MRSPIDDQPKPPSSPSVARPAGAPGLRGRITGVTRIGARAGIIAMSVLAVLVLAIVYGVSGSGAHHADVAAIPKPDVLPTSDISLTGIPGADPSAAPSALPHRVVQRARHAAPGDGKQGVPELPQPPPPVLQNAPAVPAIQSLPQNTVMSMPAAVATMNPAAALRAARDEQAQQFAEAARHAGIMVRATADGQAPGAPAVIAASVPATSPAPAASPATDGSYDPNVYAQKAKAEFLTTAKSTTGNDYLAAPRQAPISPYEVQAGSIIPATMITGINSDLPGTMIAQVSQNVYDSKTGAYLLIPAGSKIVGKYDSQVSNGQSRVLVAWQRIIFPDSSFINIDGFGGADTAGYSGLTGKVDDHSGKLFRNAILFSLIGAGATLLQPRTIATVATGGMVAAPTVGAQVAGQVGNEVSQVASQATHAGLNAQPTIEVRPGYLFNVMVDRDLVLPGPFAQH